MNFLKELVIAVAVAAAVVIITRPLTVYGQQQINLSTQARGVLPKANGGVGIDLGSTGGTSRFLKQNTLGGGITVVRPACADLSDAAASCATDTTSATNITTGTLGDARLGTRTANSLLGRASNSGGTMADVAVPSCTDSGGNHLNWTLGSGFTCGTSSSVSPGIGTMGDTSTSPAFNGTNGTTLTGTTAGGLILTTPDTGGNVSPSADVTVKTINHGTSGNSSGAINIKTGANGTANGSGGITIQSGNTNGNPAGTITLRSGDCSSSASCGGSTGSPQIVLRAGDTSVASTDGASIGITAGNASDGASGSVLITTQTPTGGSGTNGGNITLHAGNNVTSSTGARVQLYAGGTGGAGARGLVELAGHLTFGTSTGVHPAPAIASCGSGASVVGNDSALYVTLGTTVGASCTVTFGTAWLTNNPICVPGSDTETVLSTSPSKTVLTLTRPAAANFTDSTHIGVICQGRI